jgi:hypothetical protein
MKVERTHQQINLLIFDFIIRKQHKNNDNPKWHIMVNEVYSEDARSEFVK